MKFLKSRLTWIFVVVVTIAVVVSSISSSPSAGMNICQSSPKYDYDKQYTKRMAKYQGTDDLESSAVNRMEHDYFTTVSARACDIDENSAGEAVSSLEDLVSQPEGYPRSVPDMLPEYFKDLTPEGLFALWGNSVTTGQASALKRPQQMLGIGLAEASRPDREELLREGNYLQAPFLATVYLGKSYRDALSKLGGRRIQLARYSDGALDPADDAWSKKLQLEAEGPTVYGWSVVAPLLRHGQFHEDFFVPVATGIVEFDREHDGDWTIRGEERVSFDVLAPESDNGMDAMLEALSRNKVAANQVADATGDERVEQLRKS